MPEVILNISKNLFSMKRSLLFFLLLVSALPALANGVEVYWEKTNGGYKVYADNPEYSTLSLQFEFELENLEVANPQEYYLLQPGEKKKLITELSVIHPRKAYKFTYKYLSNYGDHGLKDFDRDYAYFLPFKKEGSFRVYQGYNGSFSHQEKNALDFTMPIGTEITAIREGVVVKVEESNSRTCGEPECAKFNNSVMIQHPDGSFAQYVHINKDGAVVEPGDKVEKGQLVAYSGNVGFSTGPHLHLEVFVQRLTKREYLETRFLTDNGEMAKLLEEKTEYRRGY